MREMIILAIKLPLIRANKFVFLKFLPFFATTTVSLGEADLLEQFVSVLPSYKSFIIYFSTIFLIFLITFIVFTRAVKLAADFSLTTIKDVAGDSSTSLLLAWPILAAIFVLVASTNLIGLLPFSYTLTSSLAAPFFISLTIFFTYNYILIKNGGIGFFAGFLPAGTNIFIAPLIIIIEVISTIAKFISLGVRLFANMFAGHLLLKVFYTISFQMINSLSLFFLLGHGFVASFLIFITLLETLIALLQAFVLLLLAIIYLKEAETFINAH